MDLITVILLISTGLFVGVINTYAGGAAVVSIAVYTALGLPVGIANGTTRVPVLFQCLTMSLAFGKQGVLDYRTGFKLGAPTIIGAIIGAQFASLVSDSIMTFMLATVMILLLVTLVFNPTKAIQKNALAIHRAPKWSDYMWFFLIGLYGGCFHVGVGYFILAVVIIGMGYNIIEANALKGFIVLLYIPFSLTIFMINDQVNLLYGVIHGAGNVIGAFFAVRYSNKIGIKFLRWALIVVTFITLLDLMKIISLKTALNALF